MAKSTDPWHYGFCLCFYALYALSSRSSESWHRFLYFPSVPYSFMLHYLIYLNYILVCRRHRVGSFSFASCRPIFSALLLNNPSSSHCLAPCWYLQKSHTRGSVWALHAPSTELPIYCMLSTPYFNYCTFIFVPCSNGYQQVNTLPSKCIPNLATLHCYHPGPSHIAS